MKRKTVLASCAARYAGAVWLMHHGLTWMMSPTHVVLVGGVAIAKVGGGT